MHAVIQYESHRNPQPRRLIDQRQQIIRTHIGIQKTVHPIHINPYISVVLFRSNRIIPKIVHKKQHIHIIHARQDVYPLKLLRICHRSVSKSRQKHRKSLRFFPCIQKSLRQLHKPLICKHLRLAGDPFSLFFLFLKKQLPLVIGRHQRHNCFKKQLPKHPAIISQRIIPVLDKRIRLEVIQCAATVLRK